MDAHAIDETVLTIRFPRRWKEDEPDAAGGPGLGAAFKGAALAVALAAFSQVPLGKQDVSMRVTWATRMVRCYVTSADASGWRQMQAREAHTRIRAFMATHDVHFNGAGEAGLHDALKLKQLAAVSDEAEAHLVVVSSYECVALHGDALRASASGVDLLIADEAHRMRNDGKQAVAVAGVPATMCRHGGGGRWGWMRRRWR